jgi:hypothetical protein
VFSGGARPSGGTRGTIQSHGRKKMPDAKAPGIRRPSRSRRNEGYLRKPSRYRTDSYIAFARYRPSTVAFCTRSRQACFSFAQ